MSNTLDLHGVKHADVEDKVAAFIDKHMGESTMLKIITGNSAFMKYEVIKVVEQYGLRHSDIQSASITCWTE